MSDIAMLATQLSKDALCVVGTLSLQRHLVGSLPAEEGNKPARGSKATNHVWGCRTEVV